MYTIIIWTLSTILLVTNGAYINEYDKQLDVHCPSKTQAINRVQSIHDNRHEDRRFDLSCEEVLADKTEDTPTCFWTDYENQYDQLLHYSCPPNNYISGMHSVHDNRHEDRIWKFYCCSQASLTLVSCSTSGFTNEFDTEQDYTVPSGQVMNGVISVHDNRHEDRRYEYEYCGVAKNVNGAVVG